MGRAGGHDGKSERKSAGFRPVPHHVLLPLPRTQSTTPRLVSLSLILKPPCYLHSWRHSLGFHCCSAPAADSANGSHLLVVSERSILQSQQHAHTLLHHRVAYSLHLTSRMSLQPLGPEADGEGGRTTTGLPARIAASALMMRVAHEKPPGGVESSASCWKHAASEQDHTGH